jgi:predicted anti-sigma-YlaC factor YlaD
MLADILLVLFYLACAAFCVSVVWTCQRGHHKALDEIRAKGVDPDLVLHNLISQNRARPVRWFGRPHRWMQVKEMQFTRYVYAKRASR